ncbi:MAG: hypothetical protein OXE45_07715 [bacterium]|nr:hypothetical protein [bacterium]
MDQAILALLGVIITLILYLDRGRRADIAQLRKEMQAGFAKLREEMQAGFAKLREETHQGDARLREEMQRGFAQLTEMIMDLVSRVGRLEGRAEAVATPTEPSP